MQEFDAWIFAHTVQELTKFVWIGSIRKDEAISEDLILELRSLVDSLAHQARYMQLKATYQRANKELRRTLTAYGTPTWGQVGDELRIVWEIMEPEMRDRRYALIDIVKSQYLNELMGDPDTVPSKERRPPAEIWVNILDKFHSAKEDCKEAVYCYSLERNTACVFHSMRVAEIGLRALARRMRIKLPKGKRLEWAEWQQVLKEMNAAAEKAAVTMRAGPAKDESLEFYRGAIGQFYGFKDEFRNQVMHVRKNYDEFEAGGALIRTRDFMGKLAKRINEKGLIVKADHWLSELG